MFVGKLSFTILIRLFLLDIGLILAVVSFFGSGQMQSGSYVLSGVGR